MHDVPAAGAEAEVDRGGVDHHPVAGRHRADERGEDEGLAGVVELDPLEAVPLAQDRRHGAGDEAHRRLYSEAISFSTRSSRDLNGSLHSTVRCAWSFSFRCTQSTV